MPRAISDLHSIQIFLKLLFFMNTFEAIRSRRSVKHYDATHRFTDEEENFLIDLAKEAPSSINAQHWRLVKVKNPEIRSSIRAAAMDQSQVTDASLLFVICADIKAWEKNPERYVQSAPKDIQELFTWFGQQTYGDNYQLARDEALRSASFISLTMMLTAKAMGYDSCPMIGFDNDAVSEIIHLPENHVIAMMLAIGRGIKEPWPKSYIDQSEFVLLDHF
jgi:nitroreductase